MERAGRRCTPSTVLVIVNRRYKTMASRNRSNLCTPTRSGPRASEADRAEAEAQENGEAGSEVDNERENKLRRGKILIVLSPSPSAKGYTTLGALEHGASRHGHELSSRTGRLARASLKCAATGGDSGA
jgi:hypothetical protein